MLKSLRVRNTTQSVTAKLLAKRYTHTPQIRFIGPRSKSKLNDSYTIAIS